LTAFCGYIMGLWAHGKRGRLKQAGRVLGNILRAHVAAYRELKAMPHGNTAQACSSTRVLLGVFVMKWFGATPM
jgi:hypothetical protein